VRELRHFVERAIVLGTLGTLSPAGGAERGEGAGAATAEVPAIDVPALHLPIKEAREAWIEQFETIYVKNVLARAGGNVTRAAELAGTNRRFVQRVLARLGIDPRSLVGTEEDE
jgi:DNA-binding NtrC family response regulator